MREKRTALVGILQGKSPLGRGGHRCEGNVRTDLKEIEWGRVDWIDLAHDRDQWRAVVNTVLNLEVP
jgi:hypothetical protein